MKITRHIKLVVFIIMIGPNVFCQQDPMFTHYMYNTLSVNPGYAGSRDVLSITELNRVQWLGFEGAPITNSITVHSPFLDGNSGIGGSLIIDKIGPVVYNSLYVDYSYKIKVTETSDLAFGLKAGASIMQNTLNELVTIDPNDISFETPIVSKILPNFGFGMYYSTPKWYVGVSTPKLIENTYFGNYSDNESKEQRHYFLIAGSVFKVSNTVEWEPTIFCRATSAIPMESDITNMFIYRQKYYGGAMFRTSNAVGLILGMNIFEEFLISYSFDWSYGLKAYSDNVGSHELALRYDFLNKRNKHLPKMF